MLDGLLRELHKRMQQNVPDSAKTDMGPLTEDEACEHNTMIARQTVCSRKAREAEDEAELLGAENKIFWAKLKRRVNPTNRPGNMEITDDKRVLFTEEQVVKDHMAGPPTFD